MVRVLEIQATAADLESDVRLATQRVRRQVQVKGFRPGRVPVNMIQRLYKTEIEEVVVKELVKEVLEDHVLQADKWEVLNIEKPRETYTLGGDYSGRIEFYIRPAISLKDIDGHRLEVRQLELDYDTVDGALEELLARNATYRPLTSVETIGEDKRDQVVCESIEVDPRTKVVLVGGKREEIELAFDAHEHADVPLYQKLLANLKGRKLGDVLHMTYDENAEDDVISMQPEAAPLFRITVLDAKRAEIPEMTDDWAAEISKGECTTLDELRALANKQIARRVANSNSEALEDAAWDEMQRLHPIDVPESLVRKQFEGVFDFDRMDPEHASELVATWKRRMALSIIQRAVVAAEGIKQEPSDSESGDSDPMSEEMERFMVSHTREATAVLLSRFDVDKQVTTVSARDVLLRSGLFNF